MQPDSPQWVHIGLTLVHSAADFACWSIMSKNANGQSASSQGNSTWSCLCLPEHCESAWLFYSSQHSTPPPPQIGVNRCTGVTSFVVRRVWQQQGGTGAPAVGKHVDGRLNQLPAACLVNEGNRSMHAILGPGPDARWERGCGRGTVGGMSSHIVQNTRRPVLAFEHMKVCFGPHLDLPRFAEQQHEVIVVRDVV